MKDRPLLARLLDAQVGGCSCMTKSPDVEHHKLDCHYRLFHEAGVALRNADNVIDRLYRWHVQVEGGGMLPQSLARELRDEWEETHG